MVSPYGDDVDPAPVNQAIIGLDLRHEVPFAARHGGCSLVCDAMMKLLPDGRHVPTNSLFVARDGQFFTVSGGVRVDLSTKGPLRRIFRAIVKAHRDSPRRGLTVTEVFDAGWFGERAEPEAASGRVYSAISKLRRMGLKAILGRTDEGYRLDPRVCVIEERPIVLRREPTTIIHHEVVPARMAS